MTHFVAATLAVLFFGSFAIPGCSPENEGPRGNDVAMFRSALVTCTNSCDPPMYTGTPISCTGESCTAGSDYVQCSGQYTYCATGCPGGCHTPPGPCYESAGVCVGSSCQYAPKAAGTGCNDGDACSVGDVCDGGGTCAGKSTPDESDCDPYNACVVTSPYVYCGSGIAMFAWPIPGCLWCIDRNVCGDDPIVCPF
jgi:hypothetical protein